MHRRPIAVGAERIPMPDNRKTAPFIATDHLEAVALFRSEIIGALCRRDPNRLRSRDSGSSDASSTRPTRSTATARPDLWRCGRKRSRRHGSANLPRCSSSRRAAEAA